MIGGEYVARESADRADVRGSRRGKKWKVRKEKKYLLHIV